MARASKEKYTPNDTLGGYRLVNRVAVSHSCEIWEAEHGRSRRRFALKLMAPRMRGDSKQLKQLKYEFGIGSQLDHDSIIDTCDFGEADGLGYIVMEYFPAPNLKQWIRDHDADCSSLVVSIMLNAGTALQYMHDQDMVHRDVKPDNFLVDEQGHVKLIDFNLTKKMRGFLGRLMNGGSKAQVTLSYMSPEQIRNQAQDQRADIYSYGCLVYEVACGKPPFTGDNPNELLRKHLRSPIPSPKTANPRVSDQFVDFTKHLLAKEPAERPQEMGEVLKRLKAIEIFTD